MKREKKQKKISHLKFFWKDTLLFTFLFLLFYPKQAIFLIRETVG